MNTALLDIYSDYLISSFSKVTATGLSTALDGALSHDQITRFLSAEDYGSKQLWKMVKGTVRQIESKDAVLIFDDTIEEKPYSDESELIATHYHHTTGTYVKGINILSCLYHANGHSVPVGFQPIEKSVGYTGKKKSQGKRTSPVTKNELFREMLGVCVWQNQLKFSWVVNDVWFASSENMKFIKLKVKKEFVMPIKSNRLIAFSKTDKRAGEWQQVQQAELEPNTVYQVWLKGVDQFPVSLVKQVFANKDGSTGVLYLVCSQLNQTSEEIEALYAKRWPIEPHYKSIKDNLGLAKSPTQTKRTQNNHIFACLYAYTKLERLKIQSGFNHFALKAKLYLKALQASMSELQTLKHHYGVT